MNNVTNIKRDIDKIKGDIETIISSSLNEIKNNPSAQEELVNYWASSMQNINNFFIMQCEKTGTKEAYKKLIRSMMFKKF